MAAGRCSGCGQQGPMPKIAEHVTECPDWQRLWREERDRALPPEAELARWRLDSERAEHDARLASQIAATDGRRQAGAARFATKGDILDD